jgi:hypothetical protein
MAITLEVQFAANTQFSYPYGLRLPPFQLAIDTRGRLTIRFCWHGFEGVAGHTDFAEFAAMLGQDSDTDTDD